MTLTFNEWYFLAHNYYNAYGNLDVKQKFRTFDGINYDEAGYCLGHWIYRMRAAKKGVDRRYITNTEIELLDKIGMIWERQFGWDNYYLLAENYYKSHNNLNIPDRFKTFDGVKRDNNGYPLGKWLSHQKEIFKGQRKGLLTNDRITKLNQIGANLNLNERAINIDNQSSIKKDLLEQLHNLIMENYEFKNSEDIKLLTKKFMKKVG